MANPRNIVDFEGLRNPADEVTMIADGVTIVYSAVARGATAAMLDKAVSLSADKTVQLASDGEAIVGKLLHVEPDGKCLVQVKGFMQLPGGEGATLTRGFKIVGDLGASSAKGYVREVASGTAAEINKGRGMIIDDDATSPWVLM